MRLGGLALAFAVATIFHAVLLLCAPRSRIGGIFDKPTLGFVAKALVVTAGVAIALWLARPL